MEEHELKPIVEALFFVSGDPLSVDRLRDVIKGVDKKRLLVVIETLQGEYDQSNRGIRLAEVAAGYQLVTRPEMAPWIKEMEKIRTASRLSRPGLETLAIVAYKQPVTRGEIEMVRGVDAAGVLKTLMERKLIKIVGRKEAAGRPMMYGTTRQFLEYFGLASLSGLPTLKEFSEVAEATGEGEVLLDSIVHGNGNMTDHAEAGQGEGHQGGQEGEVLSTSIEAAEEVENIEEVPNRA
ncbi:MAG: SMC-Scp complex subunit ScpB [Nitrospira sp.]|nr:SMC-Scp complex subunit ScpB [Candidatus Manganitrophaceae bacterium]HIL34594.1 SMC-Scp complex subunit ScpB [Candidatus Manganitrophaceae bacterium]